MPQVGGNLLRPASHQAARWPRRPLKGHVGAETRGYGILGATGPAGQGAQPGDLPRQLLGLQDGWRAQADGHPSVAQLGGAADGRAGVAADPDGRMGFLHRLGVEPGARQLVILALELRLFLGPKLFEQADVLVGHRASLREGVQPQGLELLFHPADPCPQDNPTPREHVQGGQDLGGEHRVAVGEDEDVGAQPQPLGAAGQKVEHRQRLVVGLLRVEGGHAVGGIGVERLNAARHHDVVADPHRVEGQVLGALGQRPQRLRAGHGAPAG